MPKLHCMHLMHIPLLHEECAVAREVNYGSKRAKNGAKFLQEAAAEKLQKKLKLAGNNKDDAQTKEL